MSIHFALPCRANAATTEVYICEAGHKQQPSFGLPWALSCSSHMLLRLHMHSSDLQTHKFLYFSKVFHFFLRNFRLHVRGDIFLYGQADIILGDTNWKNVSQNNQMHKIAIVRNQTS